jgi:hypothetical protein
MPSRAPYVEVFLIFEKNDIAELKHGLIIMDVKSVLNSIKSPGNGVPDHD